jgi:NADPH:quinone reductase-like Zn-dependent oxidoreductase
MAGEVVAVDAEVEGYKVGDRILFLVEPRGGDGSTKTAPPKPSGVRDSPSAPDSV